MIATGPDLSARALHLKPGRDRSVRFHHPWVFTGAVARASGPAEASLVEVFDSSGARLASGFHSPSSQIIGRLWEFGERDVTGETIRSRIAAAYALRNERFRDDTTSAWRLAHSEGDRMPGLVVDRYGDVLVVEIGCWGLERWSGVIADTLRELTACSGIFFRNSIPSRKLESLDRTDRAEGNVPEAIEVVEHGLRFLIDVAGGQKTGFFLDQRDNRALVRELSPGRSVLNLFSYTGGFGVYAAAGGASSVTEVDVSEPALSMAERNHRLNGTSSTGWAADAFEWTREKVSEGELWDLIVCDPPAFARSRRDVDRAARGYKDINLQSMRLCAPGALLATFSCSGHIDADLFQKIIFGAARDAGRSVSILRRLGAGEDHPVSLDCPEGEYLKGLLLRIE